MNRQSIALTLTLLLLMFLSGITYAEKLSYDAVFGIGIDSIPTTQDPSVQSMPTPPILNRYEVKEKEHADSLYFVTFNYLLNDAGKSQFSIGTSIGLVSQKDIEHENLASSSIVQIDTPHPESISNSTYFVLANTTWSPYLSKNWRLSLSPELGVAQNSMVEIDNLASLGEDDDIKSLSNLGLAYGAGISITKDLKDKAFISLAFHFLNTGAPPISQESMVMGHNLLKSNSINSKVFMIRIII